MWLFMVVACLILQSANTDEDDLMIKRHLNPQGFMTVSEIINYWGYPSEQYQILTQDGYFLQANRIPYGVRSPAKTGPRPAVLMVHGFLSEGRSWIANLPYNSLGFALADAGYDVWILNTRGTTWSRRNLYYSIDQLKFWDFSFHEIGIYDIPATIDFILQKTQQDSLYFLGHSEGATGGLVAFSVLPDLGQKIKLFIALAPGYNLVGFSGIFGFLLTFPRELIVAAVGRKELILLPRPLKKVNIKLCSYPGIDLVCLQLLYTALGYNKNNINVSRADVYAGLFPDYTSVKAALHFQQIFRTKKFRNYDYGFRNKQIYNMTTPPYYNIEAITVPVALWHGGKDVQISKKSIEMLIPRLRHLVFRKFVSYWEHFEYIWGLDAPKNLYPEMFSIMEQFK